MRYHQSEDRLSCPDCDKTFQFPSQLNYHQISRHNKPSDFLCEYCSEYFQRNCFKTFLVSKCFRPDGALTELLSQSNGGLYTRFFWIRTVTIILNDINGSIRLCIKMLLSSKNTLQRRKFYHKNQMMKFLINLTMIMKRTLKNFSIRMIAILPQCEYFVTNKIKKNTHTHKK